MKVIVEADGGSRGNPGPAGYGAVVRSVGGQTLAEVAEAIGTETNNVAEYRGLIAGLRAAAALGATTVEARMDSKLVVEQMSGRWKIKNEGLRPLALEAGRVARDLGRVTYAWIPRERNAHADRLANEAMDAAAKGLTWQAKGVTRPEAVPAPAQRAEAETDSGGRPRTGWMGPSDQPTSLLLLRHGQTPLSVERRFSGLGDVELTEQGVAQAEAAARRLAREPRIDVVVSSPLTRAMQTARIVAGALDLPVQAVEGLREADFGEWEGHTFGEIRDKWPDELTRWLDDPGVAPPGGESFTAAARRVKDAREKLLAAHPGRTILAVSHVTPIKMLLRMALLAPPAALYRMHLDVACLSHIDFYPDGPSVVHSFNDTAHLAVPR
ncbi:bifunctional RNase H/acid phosphatase [Rhizohabitans arisaemae]|uniref:bifunctional RNase H/acid phosphatase n=1 Tax=Rhizohabitans arisaemae TaxID=2720610 RepID=UPI0024B1836E|nr:bifunctional RNase H/acid phosphatase [Rhizohabitans arisaemae]